MEIPVIGIVIPTWLVLSVTSVVLLYIRKRRQHDDMMKKTGVKGPMPLPLIGTFYQQIWKGQVQTDVDNVKEYGRIHLTYVGGRVAIIVAEPEMLKQIMVKEFQYFTNRRKFNGFTQEPLDKMLTAVDDDEWKNIRNAMTPAFSGSKMRQMTANINDCAEKFVSNLSTFAGNNEAFNVRPLSGSFSSDVIARVAFGIDIDSQNNPNHPFVTHMQEILEFSLTKNPAVLIAFFFPFLSETLKKRGYTIMSKAATDFFVSQMKQAIEVRKDEDVERNDFLQLMLEAMKKHNDADSDRKPLTFSEVLSNCVVFFFAAFGSIGEAMTYALYCMAKNPDIQERLHSEVISVMAKKNSCSYEDAKAMTYMDMFMEEVLRMYSPLAVDRECSEEVTINGITFPKDCMVGIPIQCLHKDPQYWPNPEKFDPERFTTEAKADMNAFHWLPFGSGPRNCIGLRLAMLEIKIALAHLIRNYNFHLNSPDQMPQRHLITGNCPELNLKISKR